MDFGQGVVFWRKIWFFEQALFIHLFMYFDVKFPCIFRKEHNLVVSDDAAENTVGFLQ